MTIEAGTKLGPYEITGAIGAGGMGEVYRARDTNLGRDVAIKVLPDAFARDAARMARFGREAKLLAALNHTNIASIYGLEDSGDTRALVMELAEGPTTRFGDIDLRLIRRCLLVRFHRGRLFFVGVGLACAHFLEKVGDLRFRVELGLRPEARNISNGFAPPQILKIGF